MVQVHSTDVPSSTRSYPPSTTTPVRDWRAEAVAAYRQAETADGAGLRRELVARVLDLTGQAVDPGLIQLERTSQTATVAVGAALFQLQCTTLRLVRCCVSCGVRRFESAAIRDRVDLGHALTVWEPRCAGCGVEDEDWTYSF
jgi:hypothetical protein